MPTQARPLHQLLTLRLSARLLVSWIAERNRPADLRAPLPRVPDLCVEVRSPTTARYDVGPRLCVYGPSGLPEPWLVDDRSQASLASSGRTSP